MLEELKAVRWLGANVVERSHVLVLAKRMDYRQTIRWVEEHPDEYTQGCSPPTPVVFADWEFTTPALGLACLSSHIRKRSRSAAFNPSHVPSILHLLNQL